MAVIGAGSHTSSEVFIKDYEPENFEVLVKTLKQLATDSSKAKSKKDRKEQR